MRKGPSLVKVCGRRLAGYLFRLGDYLVPKDNRVVLVTHPDCDDQGASMCMALGRSHRKVPIYWLVHKNPRLFSDWQNRRGLGDVPIQFLQLRSFRGVWTYFRANYVFYTHGAVFNYSPPRRKIVVNLWHGMPIKKIWRGVPGSELPLSTFLLSTSKFFSDVLEKASGFSADRLLATGLPRNDFLTTPRDTAIDIVKRWRGNAERLIFLMPTYRNSAHGFMTQDGIETNTVLGMSDSDARLLHAWLKKHRCKLLIKPHPMSVNAGSDFLDDEQWSMIDESVLFKEGLGLYELLSQVDLLITDVSSVYVDFLITGRPQILYFPDIDRYEKTRGFLFGPLHEYAPGPIARNFSELERCLDEWSAGADSWKDRRSSLRTLMIPSLRLTAADSVLTAIGFNAP